MRLFVLLSLVLACALPAVASNARADRAAAARLQEQQRRAFVYYWAAQERERFRRRAENLYQRLHDRNHALQNQRQQQQWFRVTPQGTEIRRWDGSWFRQTPNR